MLEDSGINSGIYEIGYAKYNPKIEIVSLDTEGLTYHEFIPPEGIYYALSIKEDDMPDGLLDKLESGFDYTPYFWDEYAKSYYHVWIFEDVFALDDFIEDIHRYLR